MARTRHASSVEPDPRAVRRTVSGAGKSRRARTKSPELAGNTSTSLQKTKKVVRKTATRRNEATPVESSPPPATAPPARRSTRAASREFENIPQTKKRSRQRNRSESPAREEIKVHQRKVSGGTVRSTQLPLSSLLEEEEDFDTDAAHSISGTQIEMDNLDIDVAIEQIPELLQKADQILDFLVFPKIETHELLRKLRQPGSTHGRRLLHHHKLLKVIMEAFGNEQFIRPRVVDGKLGSTSFRPILYRANYAAVAINLCTYHWTSSEGFQYLMNLDNSFPGEFTDYNLSDALTATIALEIRTQEFIAAVNQVQRAEAGGGTDPDLILRTSFFVGKSEDDDDFVFTETQPWMNAQKPKGWDELSNGSKNELLDRLDFLRSMYTMDEQVVDMEVLNESFPWDRFVGRMMSYFGEEIRKMNREIDWDRLVLIAERTAEDLRNATMERMRTEGSPYEDFMGESQEPEQPEEPTSSNTASKKPTATQTNNEYAIAVSRSSNEGRIVSSALGRAALESFKAAKVQSKSSKPSKGVEPMPRIPQSTGFTAINQTDQSKRREEEGDFFQPPTITSSAQSVMLYKQIQDNKNKENRGDAAVPLTMPTSTALEKWSPRKKSLNDPQKGAQRLEWQGDDLELMATQEPIPVIDKGKKRARDDESSGGEESSNEYAPDTRPENEARRKRSRMDMPRTVDIQRRRASAAPESPMKRHSQTGPNPPRRIIPFTKNKRMISKSLPHPEAVARPAIEYLAERQRSTSLPPGVPSSNQQKHRQRPSAASSSRARTGPVAVIPEDDEEEEGEFDEEEEGEEEEEANEAILNELHKSAPETNKARIRNLASKNVQTSVMREAGLRRQWTALQELKLIDMVGEHGCNWKTIVDKHEPLLTGRTNVQLKDKARNMKFLYLKSGCELPPRFEDVTLSKSHLDQLAAMGIRHNYQGYYVSPLLPSEGGGQTGPGRRHKQTGLQYSDEEREGGEPRRVEDGEQEEVEGEEEEVEEGEDEE